VGLTRAISAMTSASLRSPRRTLVLAVLAVGLAAIVAAPVQSSLQPFSSDDPGSQSVAARRLLERATGGGWRLRHTDPTALAEKLLP